ncbi:hypothetical protein BRADI_4g21767v3 [Brachypodium distachyon]|uniref:Uncharacterized protein n=1 Tax=Brachypodium distachyon TaxID=15368 RepID=A0A2K2CPA0_BRADI|nr:hypothetical protein BRADI_4g21767v3 [Brachypodium distachyon]
MTQCRQTRSPRRLCRTGPGASSLSLGLASTAAQETDKREDAAEEKAIREGTFYLRQGRPSGWTREPQLLMLFPLSPLP